MLLLLSWVLMFCFSIMWHIIAYFMGFTEIMEILSLLSWVLMALCGWHCYFLGFYRNLWDAAAIVMGFKVSFGIWSPLSWVARNPWDFVVISAAGNNRWSQQTNTTDNLNSGFQQIILTAALCKESKQPFSTHNLDSGSQQIISTVGLNNNLPNWPHQSI